MADRYWVSSVAANWDGTAGSKWSATSGGAGGASVPTTADDVFFDASAPANCTIATGNTGAKSINCTGFTRTLAGTAAITVAGSVTLVAGMTYTHTGTVTITGTGTLTTAGKVFSGVTVNGSGITVTLGDALNISTRPLVFTQGAFDTASYSVTAGAVSSNNTNTRTVTLGASTLTLSSSSPWIVTATNLTFNANTSQINFTNSGAGVAGGGLTFYNVSFTSTIPSIRSLAGANTFNDLTLIASGVGISILTFSADQTVDGTFTCAGSSAIARAFVRSSAIAATRTITAAAVSANDCDFRDITIAGAAAPISPTRGGDCGGNSGITFPAAKTVYRVGTNATWAGSNSWALSSGATGNNDNFPLAQDTAVINEDTALTGTLAWGGYSIGSLDCSNRTTGVTLDFGAASASGIYGSLTFGSGVIITGTLPQFFFGRGTMVFTSAGKTITFPITVDAPGGTFELGDALVTNLTVTMPRGAFDANDYNVTCTAFTSSNENPRTLTMGSGLWTLSGTGTIWNTTNTINLTFNKNTANILLSNNTTTARSFAGGGLAYNKLTIGGATGTSSTNIIPNIGSIGTSWAELASTKTVAHTVVLGSGNAGTIDTWSITGTAGNVVTLVTGAAGTRNRFDLTNVTSGIDYLAVRDIGVNQANRFYVGANSTDNGNNLNVIFTDPPTATATGNMFLVF